MDEDELDGDLEEEIFKITQAMEKIENPFIEEDLFAMQQHWKSYISSGVIIEKELYKIGCDENGYHILANFTPKKNNPQNAFYFLCRNDNYKKIGKLPYEVIFVSSYSEDEDDEDVPEYLELGFRGNFLSAIDVMCLHWKELIK